MFLVLSFVNLFISKDMMKYQGLTGRFLIILHNA